MNIGNLEPTLPSSWYFSEDIYAREKERIFCREWLCVAREEQLPAPGDFLVLDVVGESIILLRNRQGVLRSFYNVCRHRGARLCRTDGAGPPGLAVQGGVIVGRSILCPYHQWAYDLDGRLVATPYMPGFDKSSVSLYPVGVECWGGFIFVNLTPTEAGAFSAQLGEIPQRICR